MSRSNRGQGVLRGSMVALAFGAAAMASAQDMAQGIQLYNDYQPELAIPVLQAIADSASTTPAERARAGVYLGLCRGLLGDEGAARQAFEKAFEMDPNVEMPSSAPDDLAKLGESIRTTRREAGRQAEQQRVAEDEKRRVAEEEERKKREEEQRQKDELAKKQEAAKQADSKREEGEEQKRRIQASADKVRAAIDRLGSQRAAAPATGDSTSATNRESSAPGAALRSDAPAASVEKTGESEKPNRHLFLGAALRFFWLPADATAGPAVDVSIGVDRSATRLAGEFGLLLGSNLAFSASLRFEGGPLVGPIRLLFGGVAGLDYLSNSTLQIPLALHLVAQVLGASFSTDHFEVVVRPFSVGLYWGIPSTLRGSIELSASACYRF
jgi:hypothetical protein